MLIAFFTGFIIDNHIAAASLIIAFFIPFGCGITGAGWMYATEVLNDQIFSYSSSLSYGFSIIIAFLFPISIEYIEISTTFLLFSIFMGICTIYSILDFVETKNKEIILIEMGVIESRVVPRVDENDSLQSPYENENKENSVKVDNIKVVWANEDDSSKSLKKCQNEENFMKKEKVKEAWVIRNEFIDLALMNPNENEVKIS